LFCFVYGFLISLVGSFLVVCGPVVDFLFMALFFMTFCPSSSCLYAIALLLFVVLPGANAPQPTATAQVAVVSTTLAPTVEATKEPTSTIEPTVAPTATLVPTVEATVEATTEVTEAVTEAVASADTTPTVAFPTGRPLQLIYSDSSFYVFNPGLTLSFSSLKFQALDSSGQPMPISFAGSRWSTVNPNLTSQGCGALEPVQFLQFLHPSTCRVFNSKRSDLRASEYFWRAASGVSGFRVLWNDAEVARCPVPATTNNTCDVRIPPA